MNPDEVRADQQGSNIKRETCLKDTASRDATNVDCLCQKCQAERAHQKNIELQEAMLLLEEWVNAPLDENFPEYHRYTIDSREGMTIFWNERAVKCSYHSTSYKGRAEWIRQALSVYHARRSRNTGGRLERCFEYISRVARGFYPASIACKNDAIAVLRENEAPPAHLQMPSPEKTS
jgi:hypothetical protein